MRIGIILFLLFVLVNYLPAQATFDDSEAIVLDTVDPVVSLVSPNGGETLYIGETKSIIWNADDDNFPEYPVSIYYSVDSGVSYSPLAMDIANCGHHYWLIPTQPSVNALIKIQVKDSFGNTAQALSEDSFTIAYLPPRTPQNVIAQVSGTSDLIISWDAVTETIHGTPITPDGYIIRFSRTPYDGSSFNFLGSTDGTSITHYNVAGFEGQMFYRVSAYYNPTPKEAAFLKMMKEKTRSWNMERNSQQLEKQGGKK